MITRRILPLASVLVLPLLAGADRPSDRQAAIQAQVRELQPVIEKVRGLKFKEPVIAHVIARPKGELAGVRVRPRTRARDRAPPSDA